MRGEEHDLVFCSLGGTSTQEGGNYLHTHLHVGMYVCTYVGKV